MPKRTTKKQVTKRKPLTKALSTRSFTDIVETAFKKTLAPLRGAKLPPQVRRLPIAREMTFGTVALLIFLLLGTIGLILFGNGIVRAWQERTAAAVVNGETIGKGQLERRLLQSYGEDTVQRMIDEVLSLQEGKKQNITISREEIDREIKGVEEQIAPEKLEDALSARKLTRSDLEYQIVVKLTQEKILLKDFTPTTEAITEYFNQNKEPLAQAVGKPSADLKEAEVRDTIIEQIKDREVATRYRDWIESLRSQAQVVTFIKP
ncbi:MAG TPA: SurA N-terminal domain-containing protein [Patescibacteria group bacterium]|nr:SurA N-terminal domain-containing protein [Patescibacteria group bacterium]